MGKKLKDEVEFNAVNFVEIMPILIAAIKEQQIVISKLGKQQELIKAELN